MASRVSDSLIKRTTLPLVLKINFFSLLEAVNLNIFFGQTFCIEVRKKILEMASEDENFTLDHEDHSIFSAEIDRQPLTMASPSTRRLDTVVGRSRNNIWLGT